MDESSFVGLEQVSKAVFLAHLQALLEGKTTQLATLVCSTDAVLAGRCLGRNRVSFDGAEPFLSGMRRLLFIDTLHWQYGSLSDLNVVKQWIAEAEAQGPVHYLLRSPGDEQAFSRMIEAPVEVDWSEADEIALWFMQRFVSLP